VEARTRRYCDEEASVSKQAGVEASVEAAATTDDEGSEAAREGHRGLQLYNRGRGR
jgi:hypothetical protein